MRRRNRATPLSQILHCLDIPASIIGVLVEVPEPYLSDISFRDSFVAWCSEKAFVAVLSVKSQYVAARDMITLTLVMKGLGKETAY